MTRPTKNITDETTNWETKELPLTWGRCEDYSELYELARYINENFGYRSTEWEGYSEAVNRILNIEDVPNLWYLAYEKGHHAGRLEELNILRGLTDDLKDLIRGYRYAMKHGFIPKE